MTLQQLRYAIGVADLSSMNKAAKEFYLSQPALSSAIRDVEEEIGFSIFERNSRGVLVTPEGHEFLSYARQIVTQYSLMEDRYIRKERKECFSVSTQHYSFAVDAFIELVKDMGMEKYEFSLMEMRTADIIKNVRDFTSEIGVLYLDSDNEAVLTKMLRESSLSFTHLFDCSVCVYMASSHPLAKKKLLTLEELEPYPNLSFDQGTENSFYFAEEVLSTYDYDRMIKANDRATMLNLMTGLNGYTLCSGIISENLNGSGYVAVPLKSDHVMHLGFIHRSNSILTDLAEKYVSYLKSYEKYAMN